MAPVDEDEGLFDDIYGSSDDDNDTKDEVNKEPEVENEKSAAGPESSNETQDMAQKSEGHAEGALETQQESGTHASETHEDKGLTSVAIGKQLQEKSEYFNRDQGKMFIGGLNWDTTEETLTEYFGQYGEIIDFTIMRDNLTGRSRGFGFLTFKHSSSVDEVLKKQHVLDGKVIDPKRAIPKEEQDKTGKIFVGGIASEVTDQEFDEFFSQFGNVIDAQLMIDKDSGRSRGFGFVTYDSPLAVEKVTANKYLELKGKRMEIKRAEPRNQQSQNSSQRNNQRYMGAQQAQYGVPMAGYTPQMMQQYWQYWMMQQQGAAVPGAVPGVPGQMPQYPGYETGPQNEEADNGSSSSGGGGGGGSGLKRALPKGPRNGSNRGRGGYGRSSGYHPYNR